jgi:hypothetical protein
MDQQLNQLLVEAKAKETERKALDSQSRALRLEEDFLKAEILACMIKMGLRDLTANGVAAHVEEKQKPYIANFSELEGYIREHGALDLLQKRLTESAVRLRWEDGIQIPGVGVTTEQKLTLK